MIQLLREWLDVGGWFSLLNFVMISAINPSALLF